MMTKFTKIFAMFILAAFVFTSTAYVAEAKTSKKANKTECDKECKDMKDCKKECLEKDGKTVKKECMNDDKTCKAECKDTKMSKASSKECCKDGKTTKSTKTTKNAKVKTTEVKTTEAEPVKMVK